MNHTKEPWFAKENERGLLCQIVDDNGNLIAQLPAMTLALSKRIAKNFFLTVEDDARRIANCVNVCKGINNHILAATASGEISLDHIECMRALSERLDLLEAVKKIQLQAGTPEAVYALCKEVIAKVES